MVPPTGRVAMMAARRVVLARGRSASRPLPSLVSVRAMYVGKTANAAVFSPPWRRSVPMAVGTLAVAVVLVVGCW